MYTCIYAYYNGFMAKILPKKNILEQISTRFEKDTLTKASMVGCCPQEEMETWGMGQDMAMKWRKDELTMKVSGNPRTHTCFLNGGYGISPS